jgi:hypothetical protein
VTANRPWLRRFLNKELHDEEETFQSERVQAAAARDDQRAGLDWYSFTVAFKGVLLEGLEVVFIVIAFGSAQGQLGPAAAGAGVALVVVVVAGVLAKGPLSRVPENTIKFVVGLLLTSFGCFWGAEGRRRLARRRALAARRDRVLRAGLARARARTAPHTDPAGYCGGRGMRYLRSFGRFWWNFVVGDDGHVAAGVAIALGVTYFLTHNGVNAWWLLPASVALVLTESLRHTVRPRGQEQPCRFN